jgi:CIC family chloride channel protein
MFDRTKRAFRASRRAAGETGDTAWTLALAALVGVGVGAAAVLLIAVVHLIGDVFAEAGDRSGIGDWMIFISVPLGFLGAWWIATRFAPEVEGDGVPEATAGLALHGGYLGSRSIPFKIIATALTLGGGGSAGREGPVVQIGAAVGSFVSRKARLGEDQIRSMVAAGAGAAIGASFNAPIAGMLFAMEVILRSFAARHLSSVVVASVAAAVTTEGLSSAFGLEEILLIAFPFGMEDSRELILYLALGLVVVLVAWTFLRSLDIMETFAERLPGPKWMRPALFGLAVAAVGFFEPHVLGTGQEFTRQTLQLVTEGDDVWWALLLLVGLKLVTTSTTLSSRGSGGAFMPSLFLGAALGAAFGEFLAPYWTISVLQPGAFAIVGMAAMFAAVARAPLTAILIVYEIIGRDYALILPLMLAAAIATTLTELVHPESVYTMPLKRKGIVLTTVGEVDLLDTVSVGEVMSTSAASVNPAMTLLETQQLFDRHRHHGVAVLHEDRLVGLITVSDIMRAGGARDDLTVAQAMTRRPITVQPSTPVSAALERMAALGIGRLPVVADDDPGRLVGMFRREDAVRSYHYALAMNTGRKLDRQRMATRTDPGTRFFDFRVPPGSFADGRQLREISWPEGCTIVSVRRHTEVTVPTGDTLLRSGDVVTAFGTTRGQNRMIDRLNATADEPTAEIELEP